MDLFSTLQFILRHPLSRGRSLRNIRRFAMWQVRSRISSKPTTFKFANGARMYAISGMTGVTGNLYVGLHEFEDMGFLLHFLQPGELFVDVGANVGSYTILAAAVIGADVIAFEPAKEASEWLIRNIELNGVASRVEIRRQAVGSRCGTAFFTRGLDTVNHLVPEEAAFGEAVEIVEITTLDEVLGGRSAVMLKIDVEGFESEVILGAVATLADPALQCVLLELRGAGVVHGYDEDYIRESMRLFGFIQCIYDPFTRQLRARDSLSGLPNTLFVRDIENVQSRLSKGNAFKINDSSI